MGSPDPWDSIYHVRLLAQAGDLNYARIAATDALSQRLGADGRFRSILFNELGDILRAHGNLDAALINFKDSLTNSWKTNKVKKFL